MSDDDGDGDGPLASWKALVGRPMSAMPEHENVDPVPSSDCASKPLSDFFDKLPALDSTTATARQQPPQPVRKRRARPVVAVKSTSTPATDSDLFCTRRPARLAFTASLTALGATDQTAASESASILKLYTSDDEDGDDRGQKRRRGRRKVEESVSAPAVPPSVPVASPPPPAESASVQAVVEVVDNDIAVVAESPAVEEPSSISAAFELEPEFLEFAESCLTPSNADAVNAMEPSNEVVQNIRVKVQTYAGAPQPGLPSAPSRFLLRRSDKLEAVMNHYCTANNLSPISVVFLYNGVKLYPSTTPNSLQMPAKGVLDVMTAANYEIFNEQAKAARGEQLGDPTQTTAVESDPDPISEPETSSDAGIHIKLNASGSITELFVSRTFTVGRLKTSFMKKNTAMPADAQLSVKFDGEQLADADLIADLDLEDGDMMDVVVIMKKR